MRTVFLAQENSDKVEGRGPMRTFAAFVMKKDAQEAVKGRGVMGYGNGMVVKLQVFETLAEWQDGEEGEVRKRALGKLSHREKEVLGLL